MMTAHGLTPSRELRHVLSSTGVVCAVLATMLAAEVGAQPEHFSLGRIIEAIPDARSAEQRAALGSTFVERGILEKYRLPGVSAAVAIRGELVWSKTFGHANLEKRLPVTPNTQFRIGSVSKVLTAAAVALLLEQGKLDLDTPVHRYVPEFPAHEGVTTRRLAGHVAGIRHYNEGEQKYATHYDDVVSALDAFKRDPLVAVPGERWSYSSYGWTLISAVIERVAGQSFLDYMHARVFEPLGMTHTIADQVTDDIPGRATWYDRHGGVMEVAAPADLSVVWAGGGFLSTAEDLVRFGSAFLPDSPFLSADTKALLFTKQRTSNGVETPNGIGWFVDQLESGRPAHYHGGLVVGGQSILLVRPEEGVVVAILANHTSGFDELDASVLANIFLGSTDSPVLLASFERTRTNRASTRALVERLEGFENALLEGHLEAVMQAVSDHFKSPRWRDRQALRDELQNIFSRRGGIVIGETPDADLGVRGSTLGALAHLTGVTMEALFDDARIRLTFAKESSGWKLIDLKADTP